MTCETRDGRQRAGYSDENDQAEADGADRFLPVAGGAAIDRWRRPRKYVTISERSDDLGDEHGREKRAHRREVASPHTGGESDRRHQQCSQHRGSDHRPKALGTDAWRPTRKPQEYSGRQAGHDQQQRQDQTPGDDTTNFAATIAVRAVGSAIILRRRVAELPTEGPDRDDAEHQQASHGRSLREQCEERRPVG